MTREEQRARLEADGYVHVPAVLTPDQVGALRTALRPRFDPPSEAHGLGDTPHVLIDVFSRYPEVRWLLFHAPALVVLRGLLGDDFVVLREAAAHFDAFTRWHKDTTSLEAAGHTFHRAPDFRMVQATFYLQDNTPRHGGGLDVHPGSHLTPDPFVEAMKGYRPETRVERLWHRVFPTPDRELPRGVTLPSRAGDMIVFDFRITHRGTPARRKAPRGQEKMAVFVACSRRNGHVEAYHRFLEGRERYAYLKGFAYPEDLARAADEVGVGLA